MKIVVTGATGNVGTALVRRLVRDTRVHEIVGIARRLPEWSQPGVRWVEADVARTPLEPHFEGADAVVHLAWLIQPSRDRRITETVNVTGSGRVFAAARAAGVGTLVHASSVAAYAPGPSDHQLVDEDWPIGGVRGSYYSEQKAAVERELDRVERDAGAGLRVVRLRPGLIFQRANASQIRRFFAGPLVPGRLLQPALIPAVPKIPGLAGQVVHADDVADAYARACLTPDARGAFNIAASPSIDAQVLARLLRAMPVPTSRRVARRAVSVLWRARLQPVSPDWLDLALAAPLMSTDRARTELGWAPEHEATAVIREVLDGMRHGAGLPTPPLDPHAGGPLRIREVLSGVGGPNPQDRRSVA